jgi:hypothetical protein
MRVRISFEANVIGDPSDVLDGSVEALDDLLSHMEAAGVTIVTASDGDITVEEMEE